MVAAALERAKKWMNANGAAVIVENLRPGCSAEELRKAEETLGFAIPADLKELWTLHDGQRNEMNGLLLWMDLLDVGGALRERPRVLRKYVEGDFGLLASPKHAEEWKNVGLRAEELSARWIPISNRDSDYLMVNADTGRLFLAVKDVPPLSLKAESVGAWLEKYASDMEAGRYAVEEGFGEAYLQRR